MDLCIRLYRVKGEEIYLGLLYQSAKNHFLILILCLEQSVTTMIKIGVSEKTYLSDHLKMT